MLNSPVALIIFIVWLVWFIVSMVKRAKKDGIKKQLLSIFLMVLVSTTILFQIRWLYFIFMIFTLVVLIFYTHGKNLKPKKSWVIIMGAVVVLFFMYDLFAFLNYFNFKNGMLNYIFNLIY